MTERSIAGGCACGAIRYATSSPPVFTANCHCRDCQRASGGGGAGVVLVPTDALIIVGDPRWYESRADSGTRVRRGFCPTCGSPLFSDNEASGQYTAIKVGSLDDPSWFAPMVDQWTDSAQPWDRMDPSVPKLGKGPPPGN